VRRLVSLIAVVAVPMLVAAGCGEPTLTVTTAVTGLDHPWDIGFLPNGTMLVTERAGRLNRIVDGRPVVLAAPSDVVANGEGGMLGLAVDLNFRANGFVFVCMVSSAGGAPDVRVVRFKLSQDGTEVLARDDVFTGMPVSTGRHSGCRPRFGNDRLLWVGTGDAAQGVHPQDPFSWGGKVLRLRRNGTPAPGNPFGLPWYTRGHRNVQGLAFRRDGLAVSVEQGTSRDDEVNVLRVGGNYGWDPVPGYDESRPMTDLVKFPDAVPAIWSSGFPTIATSGATFLKGRQWGRWDGALVIGALKDRHLHVLFIDENGVVTGEREALNLTHGRLRQPVQGRDGNLYVTTDNGNGNDVILKVVPSVARN
jgi:glucose/arabinose dehydrogenase